MTGYIIEGIKNTLLFQRKEQQKNSPDIPEIQQEQ